jgi:hypothetical protein
MKITNAFSGKRTFIRGKGRTGNKHPDEYQKMLLDAESSSNEPKQKPLTKKELSKRGWSKPKSLNQQIRWKR